MDAAIGASGQAAVKLEELLDKVGTLLDIHERRLQCDTSPYGESDQDGRSLEERIFRIEEQFGWARGPERIAELDRQIAEEDAAELAAEQAGDNA